MPATPELDWNDRTDHDNATRGLIDRLDPCIVRNDSGRVVWDNERWAFLDRDCPPTVHPSLWRQGQLNRIHGLFEVVPGVYQVRGLDISTMTIVEGDTGVVVVDPLTSKEVAAAGLELYRRNRGDRPVMAVVYTHSHADHFGGVLGVTTAKAVEAGECAIVAPEGFLHHAVSENVFVGPAMFRRAVYMYGHSLPAGPEGQVGFGLGQGAASGAMGLLAPSEAVTATGQEMVLDAVPLVFQLTPDTEAPAELNVYLPDRKVLLIAENASHTLHNVLTLRGAQVRDAHAWASYLTESIQLFGGAEVLIGSHHWPTWGRAEVLNLITEQRDAYAYLHDQTVRLMNRGLTGPEIAEELAEFPGELGRAWSVRGYYGSISHNVKAIYQRYMGWYDGNPAHLWQHPPVEQAKRYVAAIGGADATVAKARVAFDEGDLRWAAELLNHVVFAEPDHAAARDLQIATYERLGFAQENGTWRNAYLTGAKELREARHTGDADTARTKRSSRGGSTDMLAALSTRQLFETMAVRLDGPRAAALRLLMRWEFADTDTDIGEVWTLLLGNGVLTSMRGDAPGGEPPQLTLRLERSTLDRILAGQATFTESVGSGAVAADGDLAVLPTFHDLLEEPLRKFPIVLP
ncbi:alkyl/aryl-sulfatase [Streptomyces sp. bgisy031]|uniref:alkyl/aryl-sulfatase n=1 Tax=Streptomyces sp. bgisy031 TaxID=3413772 RepID=UPI003D7268E8